MIAIRLVSRLITGLLVMIGRRPILFIEGFSGELQWTGLDTESLKWAGLRRLRPVVRRRTPLAPPVAPTEFDSGPAERPGFDLFRIAEYPILMSLEIARHEFSWDDRRHRACAHSWMRYAADVIDFVQDAIERLNPATIVVMQGHGVEPCIARIVARSRQLPLCALENTVDPNRIICEPITTVSVHNNSAMAWFYRFDEGAPAKLSGKAIVRAIEAKKHRDHATPPRRFEWPAQRSRILFVGQCFTDSAVLFAGNRSYSSVEIVRALIEYVGSRSAFVFVKLHPKEASGASPLGVPYNKLTYRRLRDALASDHIESSRGSFYVDHANEFGTQSLMEDSDVVVTINSQGGLEAQAFGKEVVLLGDAFYDRLGTTWNVPHLSLLPAVLDAIIRDGLHIADPDRCARFMSTYFERFCVNRSADGIVAAVLHRRLGW